MIQSLLRRLGVPNDSTILLYDDLNLRVATRMFWTLHYAGHRNLLIVNGGQRCVDAQGNSYLFADSILNHPNTVWWMSTGNCVSRVIHSGISSAAINRMEEVRESFRNSLQIPECFPDAGIWKCV